MFHKRLKGVSPLIATVLLVAFTMVIAGIMATWASTFSQTKLQEASSSADCLGVVDLSSLSFNNGTVSVKVKNVSGALNLTGLKASIDYADPSKFKEYTLKNYNVTDPLPPITASYFIVDTGDPTKPTQIEVVAQNCPSDKASLLFPRQ